MNRRKRGAGEGSIFRRKDGRWVGILQVGVDENGRRKRRTVYGRKRGDVVRKLDQLRTAVAQGVVADAGQIRLGAYLERWLCDTARPRIRPSTFYHYERLIRLHIAPRIGGLLLRALSPLHLQAFQSDLERTGTSPRLRQMVHGVLHVALRDAVRMGLLARNPASAVDPPRARRPEVRALDAAQVRQLLETARGDRLEALYVLAVATGLRLGELLGLTWGDIDLDAGVLHVRRTLAEDGKTHQLTLEETKTARSRRRVDLPGFAVVALAAHRRGLRALPHRDRLVFTNVKGGPIRRSNLHRRSFKPLLARASLPRISFHALRHTAATLMLSAGVHPKVVQERLGHSSISLTLDTYSHAVPSLGREAAERLDALLSAAGNGRAKGR